jgi:hypothetical protein
MKTEIAFFSLAEELMFDLTRNTKKAIRRSVANDMMTMLEVLSGHFVHLEDPETFE